MPQTRTIEQTIYQFDELSDRAKERARDWFRESSYSDTSDFDCVIEDFKTIAEIIGITFDTHEVTLMSGKTRSEPNIYWSGFCSQGDGACFEGTYSHTADSCAKIREHAPQDTKLHRIADELNRIQAGRILLHKSTWQATLKKTDHHYAHENTISFDITDAEDDEDEPFINADVDKIEELLKDLMRWLYKQLDQENDYLNSDEAIDDNILANEYEFDEEGDRI